MATQKEKSDVMVKLMNAVSDTISIRSQMSQFNVTHGGKRDLNKAFGYNESPSFIDFYRLYIRNGIANRLIKSLPKSCWRDGFYIESKGEKINEDILKVFKRNGLNQQFERADILNRLGEFSVLYVGIPDGLEKNMTVGKISKDKSKLIYFSCYDQTNVVVNKWNTDRLSVRYGLPETYTLTVTNLETTKIQQQRASIEAHWTRVVHLSENSLNNPLSGTPYLSPIFNRFIDYEKVIGGSAEAYYRNALGKIVLETKEGFDDTIPAEQLASIQTAMRDSAEEFTNNFRSTLRLMGTTAKSISIPHNDPMNTINSIYKEFSSYSSLPLRVLTGEGGGQLAGSEDKATLNQLIQDRQDQFCSVLVSDLMNIMEMAGVVKLPDDYEIKFPLSDPTTELEQSVISMNKTTALSNLGNAIFNLGVDQRTVDIIIKSITGEGLEINYSDE